MARNAAESGPFRLPLECDRPLTEGCSLPALRNGGIGIRDNAGSGRILGVEDHQTFRRVDNRPRRHQLAVVKKALEVLAVRLQHFM